MDKETSILEKIIRGDLSLENLTAEELEAALITCDRLVVIFESLAYKKGLNHLISPDTIEQIQEGERIIKLSQQDPSTLTDEEKEMLVQMKEIMVDQFGIDENKVNEVLAGKQVDTSVETNTSDFDAEIEAAKSRGAFIINPGSGVN